MTRTIHTPWQYDPLEKRWINTSVKDTKDADFTWLMREGVPYDPDSPLGAAILREILGSSELPTFGDEGPDVYFNQSNVLLHGFEADAETVLNFDTGYYDVGKVTARNGGNVPNLMKVHSTEMDGLGAQHVLVRNMAEAARDTLNGLIGLVTYNPEIAGNANLASPTQSYGYTAYQM